MDFGIHFGTRGCLVARDTVMLLAQRAEASGYAYLGVADHLIVPPQHGVRYTYTQDGVWPGSPHRRVPRRHSHSGVPRRRARSGSSC